MDYSVSHKQIKNAFSMVEVMIVVSVVGILALIGIIAVGNIKPAAQKSKANTDAQALNTAVKMYLHSGGDLSTAVAAPAVVGKLKTIRQKDTADSFVGFTGSTIDARTSLIAVPAAEEGVRLVYNHAKKRFEVTTDSVAGYRVAMTDHNPANIEKEETRADSALSFSQNSNWVWDFEDVAPPAHLDATLVTKVEIGSPTLTDPGELDGPSTPEPAILQKLSPPEFSILTGVYNLNTDFPMSLELTNPNDSGKIVYGIINEENWEWLDYTGPIAITPADKVIAFIESDSPQEFHHSDPNDEFYDWITALQDPTIAAEPDEIDARTGSTTITIDHPNNPNYVQYGGEQLTIPANAFRVEYKLVPTVVGEGTETAWITYEGPFDVGGPQFPRGFDVVSRVVGNSPNFSNSSEVTSTVTAFYELDTPGVDSSLAVLSDPTDVATITLTNPNPSGSSDIEYQVLDDNGNVLSGWTDYAGPFEMAATDYPQGFSIVAKATPNDPYYRESGEASSEVAVDFFGIEVTGKTIFILDSSGSMSTNDRIGRLKAAAKSVLRLFGDDDQFAIIDYDNAASVIMGWGAGTDDRKTTAGTAIDGMVAGGGTMYNNALQSAIGLNATGATQVIFLSDGYPSDADFPAILQSVDTLIASGVQRFDTVALGATQPILNDMANRGRGRPVKVDD